MNNILFDSYWNPDQFFPGVVVDIDLDAKKIKEIVDKSLLDMKKFTGDEEQMDDILNMGIENTNYE